MTKKSFFWTINILFLLQWIYWAFGVEDRGTWAIENILAILTIIACVCLYIKGYFSKTSYFLIFLFLSLHIVGAHYSYAKVPIGFSISEYLGIGRNHYDRFVHFSFGLLWFYPLRELCKHRSDLPETYLSVFSALLIISFSSIFELLEWITAVIVSPDLGTAYLGTQGDEWDAQKDHALVSLGGLLAWWIYFIKNKKSHSSIKGS